MVLIILLLELIFLTTIINIKIRITPLTSPSFPSLVSSPDCLDGDGQVEKKDQACWNHDGWHGFNREETKLNLLLSVPPQVHLNPSDDVNQSQGDDSEGGETIADHVVDYGAECPGVEDDNESSVEKVTLNH